MTRVTLLRLFLCVIGALIGNAVIISWMVEGDLNSATSGAADGRTAPSNEVVNKGLIAEITRSTNDTLTKSNILLTYSALTIGAIDHSAHRHPSTATAQGSSYATSSARIRNRFPAPTTLEFNQSCLWTSKTRRDIPASTTCTILVRQMSGGEGISAWVAMVAAGFVMSKQTGCVLSIIYAKGINISEIVLPVGTHDWRVPSGFDCHPKNNCSTAWPFYFLGGGPDFRKTHHNCFLAAIPNYRNAYGSGTKGNRDVDLKKTLGDDFDFETSMGCAFGSLIQLSPAATKYQPNLFTVILPTLRDPNNAFVLSIYIRTVQKENLQLEERMEKYRTQAKRIIECALHVEEEGILLKQSRGQQAVVVWMLVTDSQYLKSWITESYSSDDARRRRIILTTQSRGAHTKVTIDNEASTADFAEAFLDWYLIGETDAVISDRTAPSFGNTATFRTAMPYYKAGDGGSCNKVEPGHKW